MAVLAALGANSLVTGMRSGRNKTANRVGHIAMLGGAGLSIAVVLGLGFYPRVEPLVHNAFRNMELASQAFADSRMFFSYQARWMLQLGLLLLLSGFALQKAASSNKRRWRFALLVLVIGDLVSTGYGFNPRSDPAPLHLSLIHI